MSLQKAFETHGDKVDFTWIYISEAHAIDDRRPSQTVKIKEHTTLEERTEVAKNAAESLGLTIPLLIDDMENRSTRNSAHPDRLFISTQAVPMGGRGPWGFDVVNDLLKALIDLAWVSFYSRKLISWQRLGAPGQDDTKEARPPDHFHGNQLLRQPDDNAPRRHGKAVKAIPLSDRQRIGGEFF